MSKIVPEVTEKTTVSVMEKLIKPIFAETISKIDNQTEAMTVFSRCLALAQEDTPEARIAIVKELSSLKISDQAAIDSVKKYIEQYIEANEKEIAELTAQLAEIKEQNSKIVEENVSSEEEQVEIPSDDNGVQV